MSRSADRDPQIPKTSSRKGVTSRRSVSSAARPASAQALLRKLEEPTRRALVTEHRTPYPGLASFTEADAEFFFGRELEVEAVADDGLIEAFAVKNAPGFTLGVQWHPEWKVLDDPVSTAIFRAFGEACRAYRLRDWRG